MLHASIQAGGETPLPDSGLARRLERTLDDAAGTVNEWLDPVIFFSVGGFPLIVLWLVVGAVVCTVTMRFINVRAFRHAIDCVRGRFDDPGELGEVTHGQALLSALSGTVGLGNIAGVAIAISTGGPGATFWMIVAGLFGMSMKFVECTLGQMYRKVDAEGSVSGGPMHYLTEGLGELGFGRLGRTLAALFTFLCILSSLCAGNMFQVNQSLNAASATLTWLDDAKWAFGLVLTLAVAVVIIGGIRRIARTAEKIVPVMCAAYLLLVVVVLSSNASAVPAAFMTIVRGAFTPDAAYGGFLGVLVVGFQRAVFSNEAGAGSASIAHSAAKTEEPVREGVVALLEPFIDTVVVCTMTALVIVVTGAYSNPDAAFEAARSSEEGARLTSLALGAEIAWAPYALAVIAVCFAFSTVITWSYYGERCVRHLFGPRGSLPYRIVFCLFVFLGSQVRATNVKDFADMMLLAMAFPNILGLYFLLPQVRSAMETYAARFIARKE